MVQRLQSWTRSCKASFWWNLLDTRGSITIHRRCTMSIGPTLYGSVLSSLGTSLVGHSSVSRVDWFPVVLWYDVIQWLVQSWVEGLIFCHNEVLWSGLLKSVKGKVLIIKRVNKTQRKTRRMWFNWECQNLCINNGTFDNQEKVLYNFNIYYGYNFWHSHTVHFV